MQRTQIPRKSRARLFPCHCALATVRRVHGASGNRLRELRDERDEKLYDLAAKLRVDTTTIGRWERGATIPDIRKIELAVHYDCSVEYLMGWSGERGKAPVAPARREGAEA